MDSGVKRSLNVDFVNTVYIYSILRRPAEDTAYIFSNIFIYFTLAKNQASRLDF